MAASSAASSSRGEMEKMGIDQLKALKEQADLEVNLLQDSLNNIRTATGRLDSAAAALNDLSLRPQGKKMLVPLTASLYVPGTLDEADKVLVDIGTGYFIEKSMDDGKDYCQRKINLLKSNFDQLFEVRYHEYLQSWEMSKWKRVLNQVESGSITRVNLFGLLLVADPMVEGCKFYSCYAKECNGHNQKVLWCLLSCTLSNTSLGHIHTCYTK